MTIRDAQRKFISIGEAAVFTGLSQETLRRYFTKGQVSGFTSAGGQRRFEVENLKSLCARNLQTSSDNENGIEKRQVKRKDIIYARVSSKKQADDLERQIQFIKQEIINSGKNPDDFELISDIGSGINFNKKGTIVHIFSYRQMGKRSYKNRKCIDKDSKIQNLPKSNTEVTI
jgi:predicted site-specific integrase-resolvase